MVEKTTGFLAWSELNGEGVQVAYYRPKAIGRLAS